jgi:hypothetical protein
MKTLEFIVMNGLYVFGFVIIALLVLYTVVFLLGPRIDRWLYSIPKDAPKDSTLTKAQFDSVLDSIAAGRVVICDQCGDDMKPEMYNYGKDGKVMLADYYCPNCGNYMYPIMK